MVGLDSKTAAKFREYLNDYLRAIFNVDELFANWLANNMHHLTDTSAELLEAPFSTNLDLVRCSTVCQINSAPELKAFKLIVKSIAPLKQEKRSLIESAIRKTLAEGHPVPLKVFRDCIG